MSEVTAEQQEADAASRDAAPTLGLADLKNVLIVIDLATSRGAFKTAEFAAVGAVYSKVSAFLEAAQPAAEEEADDSASAQ